MDDSVQEGEKGHDDETTRGRILHRILCEAHVHDARIFPQQCQFSPDGLCILTAESHELVIYNTEFSETKEWKAALRCPGGDTVRDYAFYPHMDSRDPATCCFLGTARDQPVHLYDAYTGTIRASYRPYNRLDEIESPSAVCFANNGQSVATGGFRTDRMVQLFDLNRPGRDANIILKLGKSRRSKDGQKGLVSALAVTNLDPNLLAVGTYSPGSIYLYDLRVQLAPAAEIIMDGTCVVGHGKSIRKRKHFLDPDDEDILDFSAAKAKWYHSRTRTGVTQVNFSGDCQSLLSVSRRSNSVLRWDLRRLSSLSSVCPGVASYETSNDTNQRLQFTIDDGEERLYVGGHDQCVRIYDMKRGDLMDTIGGVFGDAVNGVSIYNLGQRAVLATTTGSRQFPTDEDWDLDHPHQSVENRVNGCLRLFELTEFTTTRVSHEGKSVDSVLT